MVNQDMSKYTIVTLEEVHSTNSYALEHIQFFEDKTVIYTTHQTSGRGRYNRQWVSDDTENLYMSIVLKPEHPETYPFANLTQYLSVVLCDILEKDYGLSPEIKWPNDILINGYKISGILAESNMENNKITAIVLGLGLNVNMRPETLCNIDQKATSIYAMKKEQIEVDKCLKEICEKFFAKYEEFVSSGFRYIKKRYEERCGFIGKKIIIRESDKKKEYYADSIDDDGLLTARDESNKEYKIITGDVLC